MKKPVKKKSAFSEAQLKELMFLLNNEIMHRQESNTQLWKEIDKLKAALEEQAKY